MATPLDAKAVPSLDERQAEALRQAAVDTVEKLAAIDPDAMASRTGLRVEDLRRLKAQAAASAEAEAKAPPAPRVGAMVYFVLALILVTIVAIIYARWAPSQARALSAEQEQQLIHATAHVASIAEGYVESAASNIGAGNWGLAQSKLGRAGEEVTVLERIASHHRLGGRVRDVRSQLGRAQEAVGAHDKSALQRIDNLKSSLAELSGAGQEKAD